jgi:hypothetical protein
VRSSGLNVGGESDSFHFVYKPVQGDSEIVAEVGSIQYTHPNATAGLMMREDLGEYSPNILIGLTAMRGGVLQWRENERQETAVTPLPRVFAPYWLKLKRRGNEFSAYLSPNGRLWFLVGKMSAAMAENIYVGLAVTSAREGMLNWTTFNKVRESRKLVNEDFMPEVELVSGSVLSGRPGRVDAEELVFSGAPKVLRVPTDRVARIIYQPLLGELTWRTRSGRPGIWVSNGDFFDGDLRGLEGDKISISSVLYGLRTFDVDEDVLAVALNPALRRKAAFEIETVGGDRLLASEVSLGDGEFRLREAAVGEVRVPAFEVSELRRR